MTATAVAPSTALTTPSNGTTSGVNTNGTTGSVSANQLSLNNGIASLANNFQSFLTLLTTQLRNQDPLNPTDTNQFTAQITQMTGVEQQLLSNQLLQQLISQQNISAGANLIGKTITAPGATSKDPPVTGVVTAVQTVNGQTMLTVGASQVALSSVTGISETSHNASAAGG